MSTIRDQVRIFHAMIGQTDPTTPTIPADERVRFRARLITEEYFETMRALFVGEGAGSIARFDLDAAEGSIQATIEEAPIHVDFPELIDGLADLDYVIEGTRLEFGVVGAPIAHEVHRTNMAKLDGPTSPEGKRLKPPGWTPPDIAGELRKQGWEGGR